jgi:aminopeptidase N
MHSWYQGVLGSNESLYPWLDEGFADYADAKVLHWLRKDSSFTFEANYKSYFNLVRSGKEEPMTTHADHYITNYAYSNAAYSKGSVFLAQLGYIVGEDNLDKILKTYYNEWKFKHPNPNDFIRVAEKVSGIELQWYKEYWVNTTKTIDYALGDFNQNNGKTTITLKRIGLMPMPIDVLITFKDGSKEMHNVPLNLMYGSKSVENKAIKQVAHPEWKWTHTEYILEVNQDLQNIKEVVIDPSLRLADINRVNNKITVP